MQRGMFSKRKGELYLIKFKKKTREELIADFKRAIERKREFEEQAQKRVALPKYGVIN